MSGGGGGGGGGVFTPGWPPSEPGIECQELVFQTIVASPNPQIVANLRKGDVIDVQVQNDVVVAVHQTGIVGSIIENIPSLLSCIKRGNRYNALILNINGGSINIEVRPA